VIRRLTGLAFRMLLGLLPRGFRERHAREMEALFEQEIDERRTWWSRAAFVVAASWDVLRAAADERVRGWDGRDARSEGRQRGEREGDVMGYLTQDLKYAVRQIGHRPAFAAVLVVTLALGIGANTAVFSVVDGVLPRPLPYPAPDRLAVLWTQFPGMNLMEFQSSWPEYEDYRAEGRAFEEIALWNRTQATITGGDSPERLQISNAT